MKKKVLTVLLTGAMVASMAAGATVVSAEDSDNTLTVWAWDQNFNIKSMQIAADQYAADHGVVIDRWYEDDGISGYIFDRPGFQQMMADLDKDIDTVYVKDFSRLGRHNAKVLLLLDEFQERGKHLVVIDDN